ncbi:MAG TPA: hypothetical protein VEO01_19035, partial [Pseudonocardiaceae bacterium]|nr:hypothetical protein [Pseudonocardiaceae bacterium]
MGWQQSEAPRDADWRRARAYEARARAGGDLPTRTFNRYPTQAPTTRYPQPPGRSPQPPPRSPRPPNRFPGSDDPTVEIAGLTELVERPADIDPPDDGDRRAAGHRAPRRPQHRFAKPVRRAFLLALALCLILTGWNIIGYLTAPGTDTTAARIAEWGRDHGMGDLVTFLEKQQYQQNQPKVGGAPAGGIPQAAGAVPGVIKPVGGLPAPAALPPLAGAKALPGEGQWQTVVTTSKGQPAVRVTSVRPDTTHTSYLAGVMWIDPTFVRGQLRPGTNDPGGTWQAATSLTIAEQQNVAAAFNAGFRLPRNASHGGYYSEGRTAVPLQDGAASLVLHTNGTATVGAWNSEVRMAGDVASVRQNLVMLVDNGKVSSSCATGGQAQWGATIGQAAYIDRSAFGVTATGAEVYVGGSALSVCTLGRILQDAGVVRG